jgi:hypothetical protein
VRIINEDLRHSQWNSTSTNPTDDVKRCAMVERPEHWSHDQENEDNDGDQVSENDGWPATTSERSIRDPYSEE